MPGKSGGWSVLHHASLRPKDRYITIYSYTVACTSVYINTCISIDIYSCNYIVCVPGKVLNGACCIMPRFDRETYIELNTVIQLHVHPYIYINFISIDIYSCSYI